MKKSILLKSLLILAICGISFAGLARQEKVIKVFSKGSVIAEYNADNIDYIQVDDLISAPEDIVANAGDNAITINWSAVEGATYNVFRSPDNVNFTMIAQGLKETTYTDNSPLKGANYYKVKAIVDGKESGYTSTATATLTDNGMESGVYLGITGFNQTLYSYPVLQLSESSVDGFYNFIDGLTMKNGTLLYYSVDQAINAMQASKLPSDITSAAIVTFTDGLDQGSMMKDVPYDNDMEYLDALNRRIKNETVSGQPITAYSIGIRGKDVSDINMFRTNLTKLASSTENAMEVSSMAEVNAKFKEIAEQLSKSNYIQTINLKMPGISNGTRVRFTFDNVATADKSKLYIEGTFNLKDRSLKDVKYVGLSSTSGTTIKGVVEDIFVNFKFEGVHTENNVLIKSEYTDEWTFITSNSSWQINSEFDKTENSDIITELSSAVIMLVLDCSSSLADDFVKAQSNAKDFIKTLYDAYGNEPSTPVTPPAYDDDLSFTVNGVSFNMIQVNGDSYMMGSNNGESDEKPVHSETVNSFKIGETEVTQALWKAVMGTNPSEFTGNDQLPVEYVSWDDCQTFISKLNNLTGKQFRLPTEVEWEYAARGGNQSKNYTYSGSNNIGDVAWYFDNSSSKTHPVKQKKPNELGIYDMSGYVWEWTSDWYSSNYSSSRGTDYKVSRGGGWSYYASYCRVANRDINSPSDRNSNLGLRLALD